MAAGLFMQVRAIPTVLYSGWEGGTGWGLTLRVGTKRALPCTVQISRRISLHCNATLIFMNYCTILHCTALHVVSRWPICRNKGTTSLRRTTKWWLSIPPLC